MRTDAIRWYLLLPLFSSLMYVLGILLAKRASGFGVGVWRTTFITNLATAVVFLPVTLLGGKVPSWGLLWQPALVGLLFFAGQMLTFHALSRGDVSVATPVLGLKIIFVAVGVTVLIGSTVPVKLWVAAGLSTSAIALLSRSGAARHHHVGMTILWAGLAAAAYALFDVLVQKWAPAWGGAGRFLPIMMGCLALYSVGFTLFFKAPLRDIPRAAWPWLLGGAFALGIQATVLTSTLAVFGDATAVNVVYSSRGLWSVAAVWLVGHWFANPEQKLGSSALGWRLAGALLMLAAVAMAVGK